MSGFLYRIEHETRYVHVGRRRDVAARRVPDAPHAASSVRAVARALDRAGAGEPCAAGRLLRQRRRTVHDPDALRRVARRGTKRRRSDRRRGADRCRRRRAMGSGARRAVLQARRDRTNDASEFSYPSPYAATAPELAEFARASFAPDRPVVAAAVDLMHRIHEEFTFDPGSTTIATPVTRVLDRTPRRLPGLRPPADRLPAIARARRALRERISLTEPPPGQPRLVGADASHAWLSIWCPRLGWVDLDPTNDVLPSHRHITLAWGRDYGDVSPLRGVVLGGGTHTLHVGVSVTPAMEDDASLAEARSV